MAISAVREAIVQEAREWIGTPYIERQQVKGAGCDCASFLVGVYCAVGVLNLGGRRLVEIVGDYPVQWNVHGTEELYLKWLGQWADPVAEAAGVLPGDLAMFRMGRDERVAHSAICLELRPTNQFEPLKLSLWAHCLQPRVQGMIWNFQYQRRLYGFYRVKGLV